MGVSSSGRTHQTSEELISFEMKKKEDKPLYVWFFLFMIKKSEL